MKSKPLISIILTYYKKKSFLKKTLKSISDQSFKNYELIFVYDDDDKHELNFVKQSLKRFNKKKIIINKKNMGVAKSRNIALKHSKGLYFAFIDADDIWKKDKLLKQLNFMKKNAYNFSFTSYSSIDMKGKIIKHRNVSFDADYKNLYKSNFIGLSTVMIDKKILPLFKFPNLRTQEDFALWLKLTRRGVELKHLKNNLSFWRKTKNSLSSNIYQKFSDAFKLYYFYEKKNFIFSIYSVIVLSYNKILNNYFK